VTKAEKDAQFEHYYRTYSTRELASMLVNADASLERRRLGTPRPHAAKLLIRAMRSLEATRLHNARDAKLAKEIRDYLDACGVPTSGQSRTVGAGYAYQGRSGAQENRHIRGFAQLQLQAATEKSAATNERSRDGLDKNTGRRETRAQLSAS